jgi:hypothetical protein
MGVKGVICQSACFVKTHEINPCSYVQAGGTGTEDSLEFEDIQSEDGSDSHASG